MTDKATALRRCIGSKRFGIQPHDVPVEDFPKQPSQKDGLGRMCKAHWNQYTAGLARDAKGRRAAADEAQSVAPEMASSEEPASSAEPEPNRRRPEIAPAAAAEGGAG